MQKSNCLIEALKAKVKDPKNVHIHMMSPAINHGRPHFYWICDDNVRHYINLTKEDEAKFFDHVWFKGRLVEERKVFFLGRIFNRMEEAKWSFKKQAKALKRMGFGNFDAKVLEENYLFEQQLNKEAQEQEEEEKRNQTASLTA